MKTYEILTSHLGLFILLILYSFLGAGIMLGIEGYYARQEIENRNLTGIVPKQEFLDDFVQRIVNETRKGSGSAGEEEVLSVEELREVLLRYDEERTVNEEKNSEIREYDYWEWLLFCLTVYTTIGK